MTTTKEKKNMLEVQNETAAMIGAVTSATRKRRNWAYVSPGPLADWAATQTWPEGKKPDLKTDEGRDFLIRRLFGTRLDAPVRVGDDILAVWRGNGEPTEEPSFVTDPIGPPVLIDFGGDPNAPTEPPGEQRAPQLEPPVSLGEQE